MYLHVLLIFHSWRWRVCVCLAELTDWLTEWRNENLASFPKQNRTPCLHRIRSFLLIYFSGPRIKLTFIIGELWVWGWGVLYYMSHCHRHFFIIVSLHYCSNQSLYWLNTNSKIKICWRTESKNREAEGKRESEDQTNISAFSFGATFSRFHSLIPRADAH